MTERVPPRQLLTQKFPVIGEREPEPFDADTWELVIDGAVDREVRLGFDELTRLPRVTWDVDIHCVTRWSRLDNRFRGVPVSALLDRAAPRASAGFARFASGRGHDTSLPIARARADTLIALEIDTGQGIEPLPAGHGGPVRSITRGRYFYKSVKWLRRIELLTEDRLGFWERTGGYHNGADPWTEQRYVAHDIDRTQLARLLAAGDLSDQNLIGADLTGMDLRAMNLRRANLRATVLTGADLRDADLRGANLTNADLRRADLRGARIEATDLEGVDLRRADLRGVRGAPLSLAAAQFVTTAGADDGPQLDPFDWSATPQTGMLEVQEEHLRSAGVVLGEDT